MSFKEELEDKAFNAPSQSDFKAPKKEAKPKSKVIYQNKNYDSLEALKKDLGITKIGLDKLIRQNKVKH